MYRPKPKDLTGEQAANFRALVFNAVDADMVRRESGSNYGAGMVRGAVNAVCSAYDVSHKEVFAIVDDVSRAMWAALGKNGKGE